MVGLVDNASHVILSQVNFTTRLDASLPSFIGVNTNDASTSKSFAVLPNAVLQ